MVLPDSPFRFDLLVVTIVESALLIVGGVLYYGRAERSFADVI
jgi:hypothetical protein